MITRLGWGIAGIVALMPMPGMAQVAMLAVPGATEGVLPAQAEHAVPLQAGRAYRFQLSSNVFDPMLELFGPDGAKLAEDDDGGGGLNAQIIHVARTTGTHRLRVLANPAGASGGRYTLLAVETERPRPPQSTPLRVGQTVEAALGGNAPTPRVYRLRLEAGQFLTATMDSVGGDGLDPLLELRPADASADSSPLARDDDGGEGNNARLTYAATQSGDYHLFARSLSDRGEGRFRLATSVTTARPKPVVELAPGRPERHALTLATSARLGAPSVQPGRPVHAYRLAGRAGQAWTLDLRSDAFDALLEVVGDTSVGRSVIARDDDGGEGTNARLALRFVRDEPVEVRVISLNEREGDYVLVATPEGR